MLLLVLLAASKFIDGSTPSLNMAKVHDQATPRISAAIEKEDYRVWVQHEKFQKQETYQF